jgi:hypothetical protein
MAGSRNPDPANLPGLSASHRLTLRLLVIPFLVYLGWLIEIFLLEGNPSLFRTPDPVMFILYTMVGCILIGTIVPVLLIQRSFRSGSVNMFQIGFRSLRRTVAIGSVTLGACFFTLALLGPAGMSRPALAESYLLYLPTGIASVMICWVLIGTHLQALVRPGGALVTVPAGVVITSILFGLTMVVHTHPAGQPAPLVPAILLGMVTALFFFAARDVYSTVIVLTTGMVLLFSGSTGIILPAGALPLIALCACAGFAALIGVHLYFSRRYATVIVVPD